MSKPQATRRLERSANEPIDNGGTTAVQPTEQPAVQIENTAEQAAVQPAEQDPIAALKLEVEQAIASPDTHTAAALADLCQVSSATIRNRWSAPVEQAIAPYPLRAADGRYTDLAAWAFADYRRTVAIDAQTKQAWIAQIQALLPAQQLFMTDLADLEFEDEPEETALAIVPVASAEIVVDGEWLDQTAGEIDQNLEQISQMQLDLSTTIATAGESLALTMRRLADQHATQALAAYQSQLQQNMAAVLGQTTQASTGQTTAKKQARAKRSPAS